VKENPWCTELADARDKLFNTRTITDKRDERKENKYSRGNLYCDKKQKIGNS